MIEQTTLSRRAKNALIRSGIKTHAELKWVARSRELTTLPGIGDTPEKEIRVWLKEQEIRRAASFMMEVV